MGEAMTRNSVAEAQQRLTARRKLSRLYEGDETAWLEAMSQRIKDRRYDQLDYKNLGEYLLDMAKRDRREVVSRLRTLLFHLLKWDHQHRKRSRSWKVTTNTQRDDLHDLLDSKTLRNHAIETLPKAYAQAVELAAVETGLAENAFPAQCPYTLEQILSENEND
jgi:hypothetical protein